MRLTNVNVKSVHTTHTFSNHHLQHDTLHLDEGLKRASESISMSMNAVMHMLDAIQKPVKRPRQDFDVYVKSNSTENTEYIDSGKEGYITGSGVFLLIMQLDM